MFSTPQRAILLQCVLLVATTILGGCAADVGSESEGVTKLTSGHKPEYPWGARLFIQGDGPDWNCVGSLIAPRVVLTSTECFPQDGLVRSSKAEFPLLDNVGPRDIHSFRPLKGSSGTLYQPGLVILQREVRLSTEIGYPSRATSPQQGEFAYTVGVGGSQQPLIQSTLNALQRHNDLFYRHDQLKLTQGADLGGPWVVNGTWRIAGVTAGKVLVGRIDVDPIACWITREIAIHGGEGFQPDIPGTPSAAHYCPKKASQ